MIFDLIQMLLRDRAQNAHAFIHHFTLPDFHARGYVILFRFSPIFSRGHRRPTPQESVFVAGLFLLAFHTFVTNSLFLLQLDPIYFIYASHSPSTSLRLLLSPVFKIILLPLFSHPNPYPQLRAARLPVLRDGATGQARRAV
jgi:hypothetical protein